jgi:hypothetical protein
MFIQLTYRGLNQQPLQLQVGQEINFGAPKYGKTKPFCCKPKGNIVLGGIFDWIPDQIGECQAVVSVAGTARSRV